MPRKRKSDENGASANAAREIRRTEAEDARGDVKRASGGTGGEYLVDRQRSGEPSPVAATKREASSAKRNESPIVDFGRREGERASKRIMGNKKQVERCVKRIRKIIKNLIRADEDAKAASAIKRAERRTRRRIAKNILAKGLLSVAEIAECAGLTVEQVERLARTMKPR